jgi:Uri superfamily endonuclease
LLGHIDYLNETIERLEAKIAERQRPLEEEVAWIASTVGIQKQTARVIAVHMPDLSRFADHRRLVS